MDEGRLSLGGSEITYKIERRRTRNSYLRFVGSELRIILSSMGGINAERLIEEHKDWIVRQYNKSKDVIELFPPGSNRLRYMGKQYYVAFSASQRSSVAVYQDVIRVEANDTGSAEEALDRFLRSETYNMVVEKSNRLSMAIGQKIKEIKIRKSRKWGSCTSEKKLTFNPYLSMLPAELSEYVVAHEVAHLDELNHSSAFWSTVGQLYPNYKEARKRLRYYENARNGVISMQ